MSAPPGFVSVTSFTLTKRNNEACIENDIEAEPNQASFRIPDFEKLQKSLKQRPWIIHDQVLNKKPDKIHQNTSLENTLPIGVIRGCSSCHNCQKV